MRAQNSADVLQTASIIYLSLSTIMKPLLTILILLFTTINCFSQNREIDSLKKNYLQSEIDTVKLQALTDLNWAYLYIDTKEAKRYALFELALATKIGNIKYTAQAYNDLGISYYRSGELDTALQNNLKALDIRKKLKVKKDIASSLSKIGTIYTEVGKYSEAIETAFQVLKIYEELNLVRYQGLVLNNIAINYERLHNNEKSFYYAEKALTIGLKENDKHEIGTAYYSLGNAHYDLKKHKQATECFSKAADFFNVTGDKQGEAAVYNAQALLFRALNKNEDALVYYKKAYTISLDEKNKIDVELYSQNMSWTLIDLKKYSDAFFYIETNSKSIDKTNYSRLLINYKQLATIYALINKGDSSKLYIEKFASLNDSIYSKNSSLQITDAEKKYETQKKEAENKLLLQQNNIKTLENEKSKQTILLLIGAIILACIIVFWQLSLARIKKQKRLLDSEKKLQHDRERISRDLHDNVGGQLSYVMFSLEAKEEPTKEQRQEKATTLANALRSVTSNLRETIWALNKDKLTIQDISDKLKVYSQNMFAYTTIKLKFEEHIEVDNNLEPSFALHLFRICQEIINNAFKHANASELIIEVWKQENIKISITDNGIGFNANSNQNHSHGLANLKNRAAEINATLTINSVINKGTCITLIV